MSGFPCLHCNADVPAGAASCPECARPPVVCGRYRLEAVLGKGGMGTVYDARDTADGSPVAVKLVTLKDGVDWKVFELFERGTEVLRQLRHSCLPKLHAFEKTAAGALVLVRERFDGGSLEERVLERHRRYSPAELRRMLETLLDLLDYLHGRAPPVLHRDIKASNIMFRTAADEAPVLVDFDTVAAPGDQTHRTTLVVSPGYTAPEQYAGDVSPASDLYSLGATMLLAATGTHPDELPRRDGRFVVDAPLRHLPDDLRSVILRLVEPEKRNRFARAEEALAVLRAKPAPAPRASPEPARPDAEKPPSRKGRRAKEAAERKRQEAAARRAQKVEERPGTDAAKDGWRRPTLKQLLLALGLLAVGIPCFLVDNLWLGSICATVSGFGVALALILGSAPTGGDAVASLVGTGLACTLIAGWMVGSIMYWKGRHEEARQHEARTAPGVLEDAQLVPDGSGRIVLVGHRRTEVGNEDPQTFYRIDLIDTASGKRLTRRVFGGAEPVCAPTAVGRLWCFANERPLLALDLATLETVADWAELRRRNAGLAGKPLGIPWVDPASGAAVVPMPDGRSWHIDAADFSARTLAPDEFAALEESLVRLDEGYGVTTDSMRLPGDVWVGFDAPDGSQRARLAVGGNPVSQEDFLLPGLVVDAATDGVPLRVPGSDALLVLHSTSLDYRTATRMLTAVTLDGRTVLAFGTSLREIEMATVVGRTVVVVGSPPNQGPGTVLGLDATTGAPVWRLDA